MRKCIRVLLTYDDGDYGELLRWGGLSLDDIHAFVNAKCKPAEPLIKDEKIRKAVRAWAEANDYGEEDNYEFCDYSTGWKGWSLEHKGNSDDNEIHFNGGIDFDRVTHRSLYAIKELCGEEEE